MNRSGPVGLAAYGMPRNLVTPSVDSPLTMPYLVVTVVMPALCHNHRRRGQPRWAESRRLVWPRARACALSARSRLTPVTDDNAALDAGATTDDNDWRVTVRLHAGDQAGKAVEH